VGAGHPRQQPARQAPLRGRELRRAAGDAARVGALRLPARGVHGRRPRQARADAQRRRRHAVSR
jgi:hypothetical protein